jgi:hypothetical protein
VRRRGFTRRELARRNRRNIAHVLGNHDRWMRPSIAKVPRKGARALRANPGPWLAKVHMDLLKRLYSDRYARVLTAAPPLLALLRKEDKFQP